MNKIILETVVLPNCRHCECCGEDKEYPFVMFLCPDCKDEYTVCYECYHKYKDKHTLKCYKCYDDY